MMREEDKPFVCYQRGRWSFKIAPRNAAGVRASIVWMLALAPIIGLFVWAMNVAQSSTHIVTYTALYLAAMLVWAVSMIRWMKARSEIVDLEELMQIKRERDEGAKTRRY
jgi:Flp pilus assembly protein TadB